MKEVGGEERSMESKECSAGGPLVIVTVIVIVTAVVT